MGGSGLGLSIIYNQVVKLWNGIIQCSSQEGNGFYLDMFLKVDNPSELG